MIYFDVPFFGKIHKEQLQAMCAAPPQLSESKDEFAYLPVDSIYTTGNGLPSFIVKKTSKANTLLTISNDSDVICTHWFLANLLHEFISKHQQKWLNKLMVSPLPILQHSLMDQSSIYPISGLNSLYLTLLCDDLGITDNVWGVNKNHKHSVYLSSYIHKLSKKVEPSANKVCAHPFLFSKATDQFHQHIYAGINISPVSKNYRTFCERLPFKPLGMQYTPSSWVSILINKFSHFKTFKTATTVASDHPDLFAALIVSSVGLPANLLLEHTNFCSFIEMSKYELCEKLLKISPLIDYCTTLMTDKTQMTSGFSYFVDQENHDIEQQPY